MTPEALSDIHALCFTSPRPWSADEFRQMLASPGVILCPKPFGFLLGRIMGPEAEILTLGIHPDHRRQGHAAALVAAFELCAKDQGVEDMFLEVAATNKAAIALYERHGFREAGYRKDYYGGTNGEKVSALVMTMRIAGE